MKKIACIGVGVVLLAATGLVWGETATDLNDSEARPGEWGFRPVDGKPCATTPPGFVWRPQSGAEEYELQCARGKGFASVAYEVSGLKLNCHCPPKVFEKGKWYWRFRYRDGQGRRSAWSRVRSFVIGEEAVAFPLPTREELLKRIPKTHPRLFVRPEEVAKLRALARTRLKPQFDDLVNRCEGLLKNPPPTREPAKYPSDVKRGDERWRKIWWGNRTYTRRVLDGAATLGFTRLLGGKEEYGRLAKRLLLAAAEWDPKGATGYRYNDEAGMPYAYYFARTYTFVYDLLSEAERETCRKVMRIRGGQMYGHLCPRHLWRPYASHSNRAWHFLGEVAVVFLDEIPEAEDWLWFSMNVFANMYPVWCDDDGGWHEGSAYWASYLSRFTWWADVMRVATGINAYENPFFSQVGYYAMYLQPPGTVGGGFGDQTAQRRSSHNRRLMTTFASQAKNPYWQWYVDAHGGPMPEGGYVGFVRGAAPRTEAQAPTDLPTSRCFQGTGQAVLNTNLLDAKQNVEIVFKSSPFGTQSHGYEAQNSFLLYAFGERLLIRSGKRDMYGSVHHKNWMWHTKSTNSITINDRSQFRRSVNALGRIRGFSTSKDFDYVSGEAGGAYGNVAKRFTRHILFVKPELIVIFDRLEASEPATFEWRLHAVKEMKVGDQRDILVQNKEAACHVSFLVPEGLKITQTNKFDPPPRPRVKLVEWHLTAQRAEPARRCEFVTLVRPHRIGQTVPTDAKVEKTEMGYRIRAALRDGEVVVGLRTKDTGVLKVGKLVAERDVAAVRYGPGGNVIGKFLSPDEE